MHVTRAQAEVAVAQHRSAKIGVGARIVLAADDHDFLVLAARNLNAQVGPGPVAAVITVNFGELLQADLIQGIVGVQEYGECVEPHDVLDGVLAIVLRQFEFLVLYRPAGIGDIDGSVDQRRDSGAGAAPADRNDNRRIDFLVGLGPWPGPH